MVAQGLSLHHKPLRREAEAEGVGHQSLAQVVVVVVVVVTMEAAGVAAAVVSTAPTPAQVVPEGPASSSSLVSRRTWP